eukprot:2255703-Pyramimonas_sp.AAC.1
MLADTDFEPILDLASWVPQGPDTLAANEARDDWTRATQEVARRRDEHNTPRASTCSATSPRRLNGAGGAGLRLEAALEDLLTDPAFSVAFFLVAGLRPRKYRVEGVPSNAA